MQGDQEEADQGRLRDLERVGYRSSVLTRLPANGT